MLKYIKEHWIIVVLILLVWGITLRIVFNKPIKKDTEPHQIVSPKTDSILAAVDSVVTVIKMQKEVQNKTIKQLHEQRKEVDKKVRSKNKEIEKLKNQKPKIERVIVEKSVEREVIVEKEVIRQDPSVQEENKRLKQELGDYKRSVMRSSSFSKSKSSAVDTIITEKVVTDTVVTDTIRRKRKRFFLF
jgi:hypothetical protein